MADLPADVEETVRWLTSAGFELVEAVPRHGMGFRRLSFSGPDGDRVLLLTDRGQWMADIQMRSWARSFDLDIIVDTVSGRTDWTSDRHQRGTADAHLKLPSQLPVGVEWREAIPRALAWAAATPDAPAILEKMQHERGQQLFR